ncbi:MAG TPA: hypothetical protein VFV94_02645 [Polyangiaceae bacterium]|jgi:hypothetical protein|nr:hypothetical protein [Polyangiaceae bacterium]
MTISTLVRAFGGVLFVAAAGPAIAGCSSATVPPTVDPPEIQISALDGAVEDQSLAIDGAAIYIHKLTFIPCDPQAASIGTTAFPIDLFVFPPSSLTLDTAVSDYCSVHVELEAGTSTKPALDAASVHVTGSREDGAAFDVTSTVAATLDFVSMPIGKPLPATKLFLGIDFDAWLANADVAGAEPDDDGAVIVNAGANTELLAAFDDATASAFALYVDENHDGTLTDAELEPVASAQ